MLGEWLINDQKQGDTHKEGTFIFFRKGKHHEIRKKASAEKEDGNSR